MLWLLLGKQRWEAHSVLTESEGLEKPSEITESNCSSTDPCPQVPHGFETPQGGGPPEQLCQCLSTLSVK